MHQQISPPRFPRVKPGKLLWLLAINAKAQHTTLLLAKPIVNKAQRAEEFNQAPRQNTRRDKTQRY